MRVCVIPIVPIAEETPLRRKTALKRTQWRIRVERFIFVSKRKCLGSSFLFGSGEILPPPPPPPASAAAARLRRRPPPPPSSSTRDDDTRFFEESNHFFPPLFCFLDNNSPGHKKKRKEKNTTTTTTTTTTTPRGRGAFQGWLILRRLNASQREGGRLHPHPKWFHHHLSRRNPPPPKVREMLPGGAHPLRVNQPVGMGQCRPSVGQFPLYWTMRHRRSTRALRAHRIPRRAPRRHCVKEFIDSRKPPALIWFHHFLIFIWFSLSFSFTLGWPLDNII